MTEKLQAIPCFEGDGEVRALLRTLDWSASPLGEPQGWPSELLMVINLMLDSQFPMFLAWGPQLGFLYNDAYASKIMGSKHPAALGRPFDQVWGEIWPDIFPIIQNALAGKPSYFEDLPLMILRKDHAEQAWFTFSYSPVRGSRGTIEGMYCTVVETTGRVRSDKRQAFQLALADQLRSHDRPEEIADIASRLLGSHLKVSRVLYAEVADAGDVVHVRHDWTAPGMPSEAGKSRTLEDFGEEVVGELKRGNVLAINDVATDARAAGYALPYSRIGIRSLLVIPLRRAERLRALLCLHHVEPHRWHEDEIELAQDVARRTWSADERARTQAALRAERDQGQYILDSMTEGFALLDANWRVMRMNAEGLRMAQRTQDQVIGRSHWEVWPEVVGTEIDTNYHRVRETGIASSSEQFVKFSNGNTIWLEINANPTLDNGLAIFYRDISQRKKAQQTVRETADRLQFILEAADIGDWDLDLSTDIAYRSARHDACFGYAEPQAEWGFEKFIAHVHPEDRAQARQEFQQAISSSNTWNFECRVIWPDQSTHWIAAHGHIYHRDGRAARMSGIVMDITERKLVEQMLRETDRRKDEFLAMLAHELRNPLAPISAAADLLSMARLDETLVRKTSKIIARQVGHMTSLVDDLLDVSRVTRGLVDLSREALEAKDIVSDAVEQVRPLMEARAHHFSLHLAPEAVWVSADKKRLVQALTNLLSNAAKYTPEGGDISLHMEIKDRQVVLRVRDNGIGMLPELQERAFELFAQAERTSDRSQGGLGIGLAIVRNLVELHGGTISVYSRGLGLGSEFSISLPQLDQRKDPQLPEKHPPQAVLAPSLRIMIVDDNVDAAQMLALFLQADGHEVAVHHHARDALDHACHHRPQVCVLDIGLPDMDGNELARQLKTVDGMEEAVLIAVTGYGQQQDRQTALTAGFDHYFVKPIESARLSALLAQVGKGAHSGKHA